MQRTLAFITLFLVVLAPFTMASNVKTLETRFRRALEDEVADAIEAEIEEIIATGGVTEECAGCAVGEDVADYAADSEWMAMMEGALDNGSMELGFGDDSPGWTILELLSVETQIVAGENFFIVANLEGPLNDLGVDYQELSGAYWFTVYQGLDTDAGPAIPQLTTMRAATDAEVLAAQTANTLLGTGGVSGGLEVIGTGLDGLGGPNYPDGSHLQDWTGYLLTIYPDLVAAGTIAGTGTLAP